MAARSCGGTGTRGRFRRTPPGSRRPRCRGNPTSSSFLRGPSPRPQVMPTDLAHHPRDVRGMTPCPLLENTTLQPALRPAHPTKARPTELPTQTGNKPALRPIRDDGPELVLHGDKPAGLILGGHLFHG